MARKKQNTNGHSSSSLDGGEGSPSWESEVVAIFQTNPRSVAFEKATRLLESLKLPFVLFPCFTTLLKQAGQNPRSPLARAS